jgi:type IV secretion system protein TrbL
MAADSAEKCGWLEAKCKVGEVVSDFAQGQIADFVKSFAEGAIAILKTLTTFWMELPSPTVTSESVGTIQASLSWYTFALALIGIFVALGRMVFTQQFGTGMSAVKMLINLIVVTGVYATAFTALIGASDAFAPWIVEKATGQKLDLAAALNVGQIMAAGIGPALLLGTLAFVGSFANVVFMLLRAVMIAILFAFIPTLAASSATEMGNQAFKKAQGYLVAFVLFKPIAGVIYAVGFLAITKPPPFTDLGEQGNALYSTSVGVMTLFVAFLALPALIKFIVPVAANGTSGAFSGAGVAAAGVAAGGAVVTLGAAAATGGASVAAGGAATAAKGAAASGGSAATAGGVGAAFGGGANTGAASSPAAASGGGGGGSTGGGGAGAAAAPGGQNTSGGTGESAASGTGTTAPVSAGGQGGTGSGTPASPGAAGGEAVPDATASGGASSGGAVPSPAPGGSPDTGSKSGSGRALGDLAAAGGDQAQGIDDAAEEKS